MAVFTAKNVRWCYLLVVIGLLQTSYVNSENGLLLRMGTTMLNDGESVPIISIGNDTGNSVVCDTNNTNRNCCRNDQSGMGAIGNWYLPNGSAVITRANLEPYTDTLYRVVAAQQVRLESRGSPVGPLGVYTCSVPDMTGRLVNATINITNEVSVNSSSITPNNPKVEAGQSLNLTCNATITGRGTPHFNWTGQEFHGSHLGGFVEGRANQFSNTVHIQRVRQANPIIYCIVSISNSNNMISSAIISVTVPNILISITESRSPRVGTNYTLTCNVDIPSTLMTIIHYSWSERNDNIVENIFSNQLDLSPLGLSHNRTNYICHIEVFSEYLNNSIKGISEEYRVIIYGLLLRIGSKTLKNGDTINITDIGMQNQSDSDNPGNTLVCDTTYVNYNCCRNSESGTGTIGNWYTPMGHSVVTLNSIMDSLENRATLYRVVHKQQVRLGSIGSPIEPLGVYTCNVPAENGVNVTATVNIINTVTGVNPNSVVSASMRYTGAISAKSNSFTSQDTDVMSSTSRSAVYYTTKLTTSTNTAVIVATSITIITVVIFILIVIVLTISHRIKLCQIIQFKIQKNFSASMSTNNKNENINVISNEKIELDTYADNEGQNNSSAEIHKVSCDEDTSRLYSVVDRSKKKETKLSDDICNPSNISEMYATVDKKAKGKIKPQDLTGSGSTVTDLYAVVDKKAKRKITEKAADTTSGNISDMYAIVDKRKKANKTSEGSEQSVQGNTFSK